MDIHLNGSKPWKYFSMKHQTPCGALKLCYMKEMCSMKLKHSEKKYNMSNHLNKENRDMLRKGS